MVCDVTVLLGHSPFSMHRCWLGWYMYLCRFVPHHLCWELWFQTLHECLWGGSSGCHIFHLKLVFAMFLELCHSSVSIFSLWPRQLGSNVCLLVQHCLICLRGWSYILMLPFSVPLQLGSSVCLFVAALSDLLVGMALNHVLAVLKFVSAVSIFIVFQHV